MSPKIKILAAVSLAVAVPAIAQVALPGSATPGRADPSLATAGAYKVDAFHTQVIWTLDHNGFTPLSGDFNASGGSLQFDPANPNAASVTVDFTMANINTLVPQFTTHLQSADLLNVVKFPTAQFKSTKVEASGTTAKITGDLTFMGVTRPVVLDAKFYGAGDNPRNKKLNIGFTATTKFKRSDFGLNYGPSVGDEVDLKIHAAFEKVS